MFTDFERKLRQIILNDQKMQRHMSLAMLEKRTGHSRDEIKAAIKRLKEVPKRDGGLGVNTYRW